jgi:hypothetical protein
MPISIADPPVWQPGAHAIEIEAAFDPGDRAPGHLAARHVTSAYRHRLLHDPATADGERELRTVAARYLRALAPRLEGHLGERDRRLFGAWLAALEGGDAARFGWLPLVEGKPGPPMHSFRAGDTLVLLASERLEAGERSSDFLASGFGLRVVGHVSRGTGAGSAAQAHLEITSFAAALPFGRYRDGSLLFEDALMVSVKQFQALLEDRKRDVGLALNLTDPWFTQLRVHRIGPDRIGFEAHGTSYDASSGLREDVPEEDRDAFAFIMRGVADDGINVVSVDSFERRLLVAHAQTPRRIFPADPASRGTAATFRRRAPARHAGELGKYLRQVLVAPSNAVDSALAEMERPAFGKRAPPAAGLRGDASGLESARAHFDRLLERMAGWGITPKTYFKVAQLPIRVRARAGIRPGPGKDGVTVNARVGLGSWSASFYDETTPAQQPVITASFAVGDLFTRTRLQRPRNGFAPAEYLGVAADARWVWHEIGHALLAGNVGELEFRFAHSAGDALAAIAIDPMSRLAGRARGATFPWIFLPRRHDRCAASGWSWNGAMHLPGRLLARPDLPAFKGYWSEQILSSSLFRLYRALGGDALLRSGLPDRAARRAASDYTLYLVVKAIGLLAYKGALGENTADAFVTALIDADRGTQGFVTTIRMGGRTREFHRAGGWAHKVVRWAFERQGLYADGFTNGPGRPPAVDLFIASRRPEQDPFGEGPAPFGPGSYAPVSLEWSPAAGDAPWHAAQQAVDIDATGRVHVTVGNRGRQTADNVKVEVYALPIAQGAAPEWRGGQAWKACTPEAGAGAPTTVAAGATARYGAFVLPQGIARPCVVLAIASCPDDRANTDPSAGLPCAALQARLADLVGADNNLGLRYLP